MARTKKLDGIAITDHDSIDSLEEAMSISSEFLDFEVIPGIELGCFHSGEEVHILGYFIDYHDKELTEILKQLKDSRWQRGVKIIEKLEELGIDLHKNQILKEAKESGFIGRALIARKLCEFGYVKTIKEAFDLYLNSDKPAYVKRFQLSIKDTIDLIHRVHGISVLAHPGILRNKDIMTFCVEQGIMGIECVHSKHTEKETNYLCKFAKDRNLIITGGSDYHGDEDILGDYYVEINRLSLLKELS